MTTPPAPVPAPDGYVVRPLEPVDARALLLVRKRALLTDPWAFGASPDDDVLQTEDDAHAAIASCGPLAQHFGALTIAGELAAIAMLTRDAKRKFHHRAHIYGVYTAPEHRGKGVARALLAAVIDHARAWGVATVGLSASERSDGAIRVYEALGFKRWGLEPDAMRIDGEPADEVYLQLSF